MPADTRPQASNGDLEEVAGSIRRPHVIYVSYDGAQEPLGHSQVLPYLTRLAASHEVTLISYEKSRADPAMRSAVAAMGIRWRPLRYHRRPPVFSTVIDVLRGIAAIALEARRNPPAIVHVRSYVPALIALGARGLTGGKLLFDIRGFWADERVDGGLWPADGTLHRLAKRCERRFFETADAVVTLTQASISQIQPLLSPRRIPIAVIPTCVDHARFGRAEPRPGGPHAVWSGSIGTWYRFDLAGPMADALGLPLTVLTRDAAAARRALGSRVDQIRSCAPEAIPDALFPGDVGLCLIASLPSKIASCPTRFAEFLAAGMPVIVTPGVGDLQRLVREWRVGVTLHGNSISQLQHAAEELKELCSDPGLSQRCRQLAASHFDVELGAKRYAALYEQLLKGPGETS